MGHWEEMIYAAAVDYRRRTVFVVLSFESDVMRVMITPVIMWVIRMWIWGLKMLSTAAPDSMFAKNKSSGYKLRV